MPTMTIIAARRMYINEEVQPGDRIEVPARLGAALIALGRATDANAPTRRPAAEPVEAAEVERAVARPQRK